MTPPTKSGLQVLEEIRVLAEKVRNNVGKEHQYFTPLEIKFASDIEKLLAANEVLREVPENILTRECYCSCWGANLKIAQEALAAADKLIAGKD